MNFYCKQENLFFFVYGMLKIIQKISEFLKEHFELHSDKEEEKSIIESISRGVEFKGTNLWILIFAIFIASIGLNTNSTAVIIGAMLISPLMGPIMGLGLGIGIYDFDLIKKSLKNLSLAVVISLLTSSIYFFISPLSDAQPQSELLARTYPTIWDVFIAFFGGLAGIIAVTRVEKSNVIPGVAIATALMPPLCTAGYGISKGNFFFFLGAFYLFFINSVFISFSTFLIVRFMGFSFVNFVDASNERKIKRYVYLVVILTIFPSIYLGYNIVKKGLFENKVNQFIKNEILSNKQQVISKNISYENSTIELITFGKPHTEDELANLKMKLKNHYNIHANLIIRGSHDSSKFDINTIRTGILEEIYQKQSLELEEKETEIQLLKEELQAIKQPKIILDEIIEEIQIEYPIVKEISLARGYTTEIENKKSAEQFFVLVKTYKALPQKEKNKMKEFLKARLKNKEIRIIFE